MLISTCFCQPRHAIHNICLTAALRSNNKICTRVCKIMQVKHHTSTVYHPQIDGQKERTNRVFEDALRNCGRATQTKLDR